MKYRKVLSAIFAVPILLALAALLGSNSFAANPPDVPTVDAGIGSCKAEFHVKDGAGKALYNAKINITIKYGFMNTHKAQLEAPTNTNGEALFTGLPNFSRKPLRFVISSGTVSKTLNEDPSTNCNAVFNVKLSVH